jgi:type I site-specific restriction-modification system R (restriction) subunit
VAVMLEKYEICHGLFHDFDWSRWMTGKPQERLSVLPAAQEHILAQQDGKPRLLRAVTDLSQAFALAVPHEETFRIRDDVGFFRPSVRYWLRIHQASRRLTKNSTMPSGRSSRRLSCPAMWWISSPRPG